MNESIRENALFPKKKGSACFIFCSHLKLHILQHFLRCLVILRISVKEFYHSTLILVGERKEQSKHWQNPYTLYPILIAIGWVEETLVILWYSKMNLGLGIVCVCVFTENVYLNSAVWSVLNKSLLSESCYNIY